MPCEAGSEVLENGSGSLVSNVRSASEPQPSVLVTVA